MSPAIPPPVWILAAPFSGTSWLAGCLGRHPQLYAVPELNLFLAATVGELLDIYDVGQGGHAHGLLRALAELEFGGQTDAGVAQARHWLTQRRTMATAELALHVASCVAPRRLVVPDSESTLRPSDLERMGGGLSGLHLVHLVRHPWEQGALLAAWARQRLFVPQDYKDHAYRPPQVDPQIPWLRCNRNVEALLSRVDASRWRRIRCEDVEKDPVAALRPVCAWLGVRDDPEALQPMNEPDRWTFAGYGPGTAPYGLEAEVLETIAAETIELASRATLERPPPWQPGADAGFDPQLIGLAREYGYR
jgi:hypothetical protein